MKRKLFLVPLALGLAIGMASCGEEAPQPSPEGSYTIKVYDIDDVLLGEKTIELKDYPKLVDGLNANFNVKSSQGEWGTMISQINDSILDNNYYISILENGAYAQVGVDSLEANDGDVFEFKNECYNTVSFGGELDEYDLLVDKVIYRFAKNKLKENVKKATTYLSSIYWEQCMSNLMLVSGYSESLFDLSGLYTDAFKGTVTSADLTKLPEATEYPSDANYAKWYYAARAIKQSTTDFIPQYTAYLDGVKVYPSLGEYTLPFTLSFAKTLGLESHINADVLNTTYRAGTTYGVDGICWQLAGLAEYKGLADTELSTITLETINNSVSQFGAMKDVSLANILIPLAAMNKDARSFKIEKDKDVLAYLFDNCFDKTTYQFDVEKVEGNTSASQIYASLMAYKARRDTKKAAYLFA